MRSWLYWVVACTVILTASDVAAQTPPRQFRMGAPFATNSNLHKAMEKFAEIVGTETNGAIKVLVYPDSQIGDFPQLISGLQLGTVDMALLGIGNAAGLKGGAALNVGYTPYLFKSRQKAIEAYNGPLFAPLYETLASESGLRIFAVAGSRSWRAVQTTKGPIVKPGDLRGMRLRIPGIEMFRAAFEGLGVKVVPTGLGDVYNALSRGLVEGQDNGLDLALQFKWHEVAKHWSMTDHVIEISTWYMGEKQWQSLTPEQQALFKRAANEAGKLSDGILDDLERQGLDDLRKAGVTVTKPDVAAFRDAWKDVHQPFEGKLWPAGLVGTIRASQE